MKTLKISEITHQQLVDLQNELYQRTKMKYTFNEIISIAIINQQVLEGKRNVHK